MTDRVRWGILGTANIALTKVIPAMQRSPWCEIAAIASRDPAGAIALADELGVGRDDGSVEHLVQIWAVEDPEAAWRWIETQPEGSRTDELRARINQARQQASAARK